MLEPYSNNILKRVVKSPKIYFHDTGLICYLTRWTTPEVLKNGAKAGNIFENFVVSEIMKTHLNAGKTISSIYYYRDKDKKEIDLIIEKDGVLYPIEIKMSANPTKGMAKNFSVLHNIPDKASEREQSAYPAERIVHTVDRLYVYSQHEMQYDA